jgi:hypothetical protein
LWYKGVDYVQKIDVRRPLENVTFVVFDTTDSDEALRIDFYHIIIERDKEAVRISEFLQYRNVGSKVYNGTEIKISMPADYSDLTGEHDCCMVPTEYGLAFNPPSPIKPNLTQYLEFSYRLTPETSPLTFSKKAFYNISSFVILVAADLRVENFTNLQKGDEIDMEGRRFVPYFKSSIPKDDEIKLVISGVGGGGKQWLWVGALLIILFIGGVVVYGMRSGRKSVEKLLAEKKALEEVLQALESDYGDGKLDELQYLKLKLKYTEKLKRIEKRLNSLPVDKKGERHEKG